MNTDRETIKTHCRETLEGIHADYREDLLQLTLNKSRTLSTWAEVTDAMQNIASILKMPTCDTSIMHIDREAIKAHCVRTLNSIHPDHRDDLTATTLAEVGRTTALSWTEIEAVMKNLSIENEYRAVDADELNIEELVAKLECFRVDGELCITEPTSREQFGIAAILDPEANANGNIWGVRVWNQVPTTFWPKALSRH